jgi:NitT/TauT family transport system substrate-binding protein
MIEPNQRNIERPLSRRQMFQRTAAVGAAVAIPAWLLSACGGAGTKVAGSGAATTLKATHGTGLCNLSIFMAKEQHLTEPDGVGLQFVVTPTNADIVTLFGAGQVDVSVLPYTQFMTLHEQGAPVTIVAGAGVQGLVLLAQKGINRAEDLRGKTIGTFQADTLEVLPYTYLRKAGMSFGDVKVRYFGTSPELAQAFIGGAIDAICHVEPYATKALQGRPDAVMLSDGTDVYGENYTDCVLAVRNDLLARNRPAIKALIKGLLTAQGHIESDLDSAVKLTTGTYFKSSESDIRAAATKQLTLVDQRSKSDFMLQRGQEMVQMGYLRTPPNASIFDWTLLAEVITENPDLYSSLKRQSA